ncbi:ABC transporter ATP-binding protein [Bosea sp. 2YAB26]|uniref:ABC transporter ATP-binding protein n=1 Tax=Bosea sp. 2YAB26 TaxID=3237478 RepID=UPI003F8F4A8E
MINPTEDRAALLDVQGLQTEFMTRQGPVRAVDGVSFSIGRGERVALVGESGCGKSVTSLSLMRLIRSPGRISGGRILFDGVDLLSLPPKAMRAIRGRRIGMIFQEPMMALNPVLTIGQQVSEIFTLHLGMRRKEAWGQAIEALRRVNIPAPEKRIEEFPHQLSGGMKQRVMIAMAMACKPDLLIADEPTTALDVTIQAQIIELMRELQEETGAAILMISHDLGLVSEFAERVLVMYAGKVVEERKAEDIFAWPAHPYTQALIASLPRLGERSLHGRAPLQEIRGIVPALSELPPGCRFNPRCNNVMDRCRVDEPSLLARRSGGQVRCWLEQAQS